MNDTSIEARIARTLQEVAARLPDRDAAPPAAATRRPARGTRTLVAAAAVFIVSSLGAYLLTVDEERSVMLRPEVRRVLLTAEVDGSELRLETTGGNCVVVVLPEGFPSAEQACNGSDAIAIKAMNWGGKTRVSTLVWGRADPGARFSDVIEDGATSMLYEARVGSGAAFLLVIDVPAASGTIAVLDQAGSAIGQATFDHGGPNRKPKGTLGDRRIDFAYRRDGAIWVRTTDGQDIRITDGTENASDGYPFVLPDGHTIVHSHATFDSPVDSVRATDARDGSSREVPTQSMLAVSPDGRTLAVSAINDDSGATEEIVLLRADTFVEIKRIGIGVGDTVGSIADAVWDADGQGLLVETRCCSTEESPTPEDHLRLVDVDKAAATELPRVDDSRWILANRAPSHGQYPALRRVGAELQWGTLRLQGTKISFELIATLPADTGLDDEGALYLLARRNGLWLVGDGHKLFELNAAGQLKLLLDDVDSASTP
ncbi:MAG TPA: hypothetical protein VMZ22_03800 [Acidimicrobiales bacterium]|nr:hypothetical protein [Acidimicrobiales bacterium]